MHARMLTATAARSGQHGMAGASAQPSLRYCLLWMPRRCPPPACPLLRRMTPMLPTSPPFAPPLSLPPPHLLSLRTMMIIGRISRRTAAACASPSPAR